MSQKRSLTAASTPVLYNKKPNSNNQLQVPKTKFWSWNGLETRLSLLNVTGQKELKTE